MHLFTIRYSILRVFFRENIGKKVQKIAIKSGKCMKIPKERKLRRK